MQWLTQAAIYHQKLFSKAGCVDTIEHTHHVALSFHDVSAPHGGEDKSGPCLLRKHKCTNNHPTERRLLTDIWKTAVVSRECLVKAFKYVGIRVTCIELIKYEYEYALKVALKLSV